MEEKYKILIVDDEQSILDMLKLQLEFEGYSVYTAGNAAEALDKLSYSPDIVLLDINMDGMNGCLLMQVRFLTEKKFMKIFGALTAMETALLSKSIYEKYV